MRCCFQVAHSGKNKQTNKKLASQTGEAKEKVLIANRRRSWRRNDNSTQELAWKYHDERSLEGCSP